MIRHFGSGWPDYSGVTGQRDPAGSAGTAVTVATAGNAAHATAAVMPVPPVTAVDAVMAVSVIADKVNLLYMLTFEKFFLITESDSKKRLTNAIDFR